MAGDDKEHISSNSAEEPSGESPGIPPPDLATRENFDGLAEDLDNFEAERAKARDSSVPSAYSFFLESDTAIDEGKYEEHMRDLTDASNWAIPWSDLMMTMFILFAVMLVYTLSERDLKEALSKEQSARKKQPAAGAAAGGTAFKEPGQEKLFEMSRQTVQEANLEDVDVVMGADKSVRVSVRGPMLFDLGSAELRDTTREFLRNMAVVLSKTRNEIQIVGHTDNYPIHSDAFPTNWELSAARAARVARFLIEQGSLEPGRFTVLGNAMYRPSIPNTSPENKQKNRRVDIIITRDVYRGTSGG